MCGWKGSNNIPTNRWVNISTFMGSEKKASVWCAKQPFVCVFKAKNVFSKIKVFQWFLFAIYFFLLLWIVLLLAQCFSLGFISTIFFCFTFQAICIPLNNFLFICCWVFILVAINRFVFTLAQTTLCIKSCTVFTKWAHLFIFSAHVHTQKAVVA